MNNYNFLGKPIFFIGSLLFATWLVLYIEKINPSDLGKYEHVFTSRPKPLSEEVILQNKLAYKKKQQTSLKKICNDYKAGLIDSLELNKRLELFLNSKEKITAKE